ncbi:INGR2 protein, partial [Serilophus lunatus]|nr:INGR2 protein [Serilophus lunatus]
EPSPHLPAPKDVEIYSYNFHSLLRWSPVQVEGGPVLYTVHYSTGAFPEWSELNCSQIPQPQCELPPSLQRRRWTLWLRLRAERGSRASPWLLTGPFVPERNTTLGPPRVNSVSASPDSLLISVTPPFTLERGERLHYLVSYWENATSSAEEEPVVKTETLFQIGNLKESTLYCFSIWVELETIYGLLPGQHSAPECHRTATS